MRNAGDGRNPRGRVLKCRQSGKCVYARMRAEGSAATPQPLACDSARHFAARSEHCTKVRHCAHFGSAATCCNGDSSGASGHEALRREPALCEHDPHVRLHPSKTRTADRSRRGCNAVHWQRLRANREGERRANLIVSPRGQRFTRVVSSCPDTLITSLSHPWSVPPLGGRQSLYVDHV